MRMLQEWKPCAVGGCMLYQLPMVSLVWPLYAFHEKLRYIIFTIMCAGQCTRPVYGDQGIHQATQGERCRWWSCNPTGQVVNVTYTYRNDNVYIQVFFKSMHYWSKLFSLIICFHVYMHSIRQYCIHWELHWTNYRYTFCHNRQGRSKVFTTGQAKVTLSTI